MNEKATIFDYARMCKSFDPCGGSCPLFAFCSKEIEYSDLDKANEIILKWCKEHPVETRQDRFLKMFPDAQITGGAINISPCDIERELFHSYQDDGSTCREYRKVESCTQCRKEYWLAKVEENGNT